MEKQQQQTSWLEMDFSFSSYLSLAETVAEKDNKSFYQIKAPNPTHRSYNTHVFTIYYI